MAILFLLMVSIVSLSCTSKNIVDKNTGLSDCDNILLKSTECTAILSYFVDCPECLSDINEPYRPMFQRFFPDSLIEYHTIVDSIEQLLINAQNQCVDMKPQFNATLQYFYITIEKYDEALDCLKNPIATDPVIDNNLNLRKLNQKGIELLIEKKHHQMADEVAANLYFNYADSLYNEFNDPFILYYSLEFSGQYRIVDTHTRVQQANRFIAKYNLSDEIVKKIRLIVGDAW